MFLVSRVDLLAPLPRLPIQIVPAGEGTACQKVGLDEPEGPLYARRTVNVADRVRLELKAEPFAKGGHLGYGNHVAAGAMQHYYVRVIDHHAAWRTREVAQRLRQEHFAVEALKGWI